MYDAAGLVSIVKRHDEYASIINDLKNVRFEQLYGGTSFEEVSYRHMTESYIAVCFNQLDEESKNNSLYLLDKLYESFLDNPLDYIDSILLEDRYSFKYYSSDRVRKITEVKRKFNDKAISISKRGPKDDYERKVMLKYYLLSIDLNDAYQKECISDILEKASYAPDEIVIDNLESEFLYNYVGRWMLNRLGVSDVNFKIYSVSFEQNMHQHGVANSANLIYLDNYNNRTNNSHHDLFSFTVHAVCHEIEHLIQIKNSLESNKVNGLYWAEKSLFSSYLDSDFYRRNYQYSKAEEDAEHAGYSMALEFAREFNQYWMINGLDRLIDERVVKRGFQYEFLVDKDDNLEYVEIVTANYLDDIISHHPSEIKKYPVLRNLYNADGTLKDMDTILSPNYSRGDNALVYFNHVILGILSGELDKIDFEHKSSSEKNVLINNLSIVLDMIRSKLEKIIAGNIDDINDPFFDLEEGSETRFNSNKPTLEIYQGLLFHYFNLASKISLFISDNFDYIKNEEKFSYEVNALIHMLNVLKKQQIDKIQNIVNFLENYHAIFSEINYHIFEKEDTASESIKPEVTMVKDLDKKYVVFKSLDKISVAGCDLTLEDVPKISSNLIKEGKREGLKIELYPNLSLGTFNINGVLVKISEDGFVSIGTFGIESEFHNQEESLFYRKVSLNEEDYDSFTDEEITNRLNALEQAIESYSFDDTSKINEEISMLKNILAQRNSTFKGKHLRRI